MKNLSESSSFSCSFDERLDPSFFLILSKLQIRSRLSQGARLSRWKRKRLPRAIIAFSICSDGDVTGERANKNLVARQP